MQWKDITSYSRGDKDRTPRSWEMEAGQLRIVVTRRLHLEGWLITCEPFFSIQKLENEKFESAADEALNMVKAKLRAALNSLT